MATNTIKTRIQHKYDTPENWAKASTFVPLKGEICVFNNGTGVKPEMKIGDGTTTLASLPFLKAGGDIAVSRSLTSGTKIATITIDGVATDLYCQTNTDTTYSAGTGITLSGTTFSLNVAGAKTALGLGSNAYTSTAYIAQSANGTQCIANTAEGADTALALKGNSSDSWLGFLNKDNTSLGWIGFADQGDLRVDTTSGVYNILHAGNYWNYALPLSGGTITGDLYVTHNVIQLGKADSATYTEFRQYRKSDSDSTYCELLTCLEANASKAYIYFNHNGNFNTFLQLYDGGITSSVPITASSFNGNAATATKLATARSISLTGSVTGSGSFDGSGNLSIATTTNHSHSYLPLSGGTLTGTITHSDLSTSWINMSHGDGAIINLNSAAKNGGATACWAVKTNTGSWGCGNLSGNDNLYFCWGSDSNYTSQNNTANSSVYISNSGGIYGAVWNDYAEFRQTVPHIKPGQIVTENGDGTQRITTERLQRGCNVVSDTFGFAIGETDECKTPIACAGRALVYTYENRYDFQPGEAVCSGPNGTVSRMTREEMINNPDCIVGFVSEIPEYKVWGTGNVEVDGRIWIKVR